MQGQFTCQIHEKIKEKRENISNGMKMKCHMFRVLFFKVDGNNGKTAKRDAWSTKYVIFSVHSYYVFCLCLVANSAFS